MRPLADICNYLPTRQVNSRTTRPQIPSLARPGITPSFTHIYITYPTILSDHPHNNRWRTSRPTPTNTLNHINNQHHWQQPNQHPTQKRSIRQHRSHTLRNPMTPTPQNSHRISNRRTHIHSPINH